MTSAASAGGGFQGIDPQLLSALMGSLKSGAGSAQPVAGGYLGQFSRLGLDTGPVNRLLSDYAWAQGQLAMLQRRYDLAGRQPSGQWVNGMATSGAGQLQYATAGQAQTAGAGAASQFTDGTISLAQFLALLGQHEGDPDWQTGAMRALGRAGLLQIKQDGQGGVPLGPQDLQALAVAVAAAMGNGVTFPYPGDPGPGNEDVALLAPLLQYAQFPPQVLATLGREVVTPGYGYLMQASAYATMVWPALAASPRGAALFLHQDMPQIMAYIRAGDYAGVPDDYGGLYDDDPCSAFAAVITAGTAGIRQADPQLGAQSVNALVTAFENTGAGHVPAPLEAAFGQVIRSYWPDVTYAITSMQQGTAAPDGITLTAKDWATFADEAMRDPATAAMVLGLAQRQSDYWIDKANAGSSAADYGYEYQAGLVNGFFDLQASQAYQSLGSPQSWMTVVSNYAGDAVDIAFDVAIDPGSAAKTAVTDVSKDVLDTAVSGFTSKLPQATPSPVPKYTSFQTENVKNAHDAYRDATPQKIASDPGLAALVAGAKNYGGARRFTANIDNPGNMTTAQQQAYNEWLSSPAVIGYLYASSDSGQNNGLSLAYDVGYNEYFFSPSGDQGA